MSIFYETKDEDVDVETLSSTIKTKPVNNSADYIDNIVTIINNGKDKKGDERLIKTMELYDYLMQKENLFYLIKFEHLRKIVREECCKVESYITEKNIKKYSPELYLKFMMKMNKMLYCILNIEKKQNDRKTSDIKSSGMKP